MENITFKPYTATTLATNLKSLLEQKLIIAKFYMLMWDSPLYVKNMIYYHWLVKKLFWPMEGQNIGRREN